MSSHLEIGDQPLDHPLHLLVLRGELDQITAPSLAATMTRALSERKPGIIVDLIEVTSLDSCGLAALRDSHLRLARANGCLAVVSEQLPPRSAAGGHTDTATLDVFRTRTEAIAAVRRGVWRVGPAAVRSLLHIPVG
jgi:anti-anti-sigma factor